MHVTEGQTSCAVSNSTVYGPVLEKVPYLTIMFYLNSSKNAKVKGFFLLVDRV